MAEALVPKMLSLRPSPPRLSLDSRTQSRSSTPSATSPLPFNISQRARVVSGVTPEQVEAPKNYVDYEDEPDKLKDILKGRQPKENREKQATYTSTGKSPTPSISLPASSHTKRKEVPKSSLQSPTFTTTSPSSYPSSPLTFSIESPYDLSLWCHILLPRSGPGHAVTALHLIEDRDTTISPYSPLPATIDRADNGALEKSRLSIFEFHSNDYLAPLEVYLEKLGQWCYDGACFSVGLHEESDSE
ncbi:hypothetical protein H0H81_000015 [Sphagnurus paluster]|uniref:Uncharacterized protein n=1 Tax=Sphagnurus paluster TaxID=117069 RepID=A0A9P7K898_9AGAR|nr:hypothetical protein H0H81_000015 [Sphagnurus paluster]